MGEAPTASGHPPTSPRQQAGEVVRYLRERRAALLLVLLVATTSVLVVPFFVLLPSLARFTLHADARAFGFLMSCQGVGALAGALTVASRGEDARRGRVLCGASLGFSLLLLALALNRSYVVACLLVLLIGFALISFLSTANALLQTSVPDNLRGRMMGVYSTILMGLTPVGALWAGAVARTAGGAPLAIGIGGGLCFAAAAWVTLGYPAFRRMGRTLPERLQ
jgi:MFS family permease